MRENKTPKQPLFGGGAGEKGKQSKGKAKTMEPMASSSLIGRGIYPQLRPAFESRQDINPTLMMSWWATALSLVIIFVRLCGRYVRIERFFPEDKVVMWSVIPLVLRMVIVHFVLVLGTNNTQTVGLTPAQVRDRMLGSKLVLVARIFYAV